MAQEIVDQTLEAIDSCRSPPDSSAPSLSRALSSSRLNARAAEFVPRGAQPPAPAPAPAPPPIRHGHAPAAHPVMHVFHQPQPISAYFGPGPGSFEYYGGGAAGGFGEHEGGGQSSVDPDPSYTVRDGPSDEVVQKITKQVCACFTHIATLISSDVLDKIQMTFKKIKALVHNNFQLAVALRTSTKLVVSDDGKKVRRQQPFTESDMEELQVRFNRFCTEVVELNDEKNWRSGLRVRSFPKFLVNLIHFFFRIFLFPTHT
ncbi:hypothetical protein GW17_00017510 [Ensete ventricosum]|nr:hypothetical protein GW17_00017510 [Ensete ventricosum]